MLLKENKFQRYSRAQFAFITKWEMPKNNQFGSIRSTMLTVGNIWLGISSEDFDAPFMSRVTEADHGYRSGAEAEIPSRRIE